MARKLPGKTRTALSAVILTLALGTGNPAPAGTVCVTLGASTLSSYRVSGTVKPEMHGVRKLADQMQALGSLEGIDLTVWDYAVAGGGSQDYWNQLYDAQTELAWKRVDCVVIDVVGETLRDPGPTIRVLDPLIDEIRDKQVYVVAYPVEISEATWSYWPLDEQITLMNAQAFNTHFRDDQRVHFVPQVWDNYTPLPDDYHPDSASGMRAAIRLVDTILRDTRAKATSLDETP